MSDALVLHNVIKRYGRQKALDGLDLAVPVGTIAGLVGANGAGKTTTLGICCGLIRPDAGQINILGDGPFSAGCHAGRVALLPQDTELPGDSTPESLLRAYGMLQGLTRKQAGHTAAALLERLHLADRMRSRIRTLSHGMRKRVMIAQCFLGNPELILLDEPLSGLDPREVASMRDFIREARDHRTLILSSHNLDEIERLCDRVAMIERGRCIRHETLSAFTSQTARLEYRILPASLPLQTLSEALPGVSIEANPDTGHISFRFDPSRFSPAEINLIMLPLLLREGIGIREIRCGEPLENVYLNHV